MSSVFAVKGYTLVTDMCSLLPHHIRQVRPQVERWRLDIARTMHELKVVLHHYMGKIVTFHHIINKLIRSTWDTTLLHKNLSSHRTINDFAVFCRADNFVLWPSPSRG